MDPALRRLHSLPVFPSLGVVDTPAQAEARRLKHALADENKMEEWILQMQAEGKDWMVKLEVKEEEDEDEKEGAKGGREPYPEVEEEANEGVNEKSKGDVEENINVMLWHVRLRSADLTHLELD